MGLLQEQPRRMALEKRLLAELAAEENWFRMEGWCATEDGDVSVNFGLQLPRLTFDGVLVYPEYFPDVPAYIRPRKYGERWSQHQYGGAGVLCLERGPDNWHSDVTGAELVRSAYRLLCSEIVRILVPETPEVPSRHIDTLGRQARSEKHRLVMTRGLSTALRALPPDQPCALKTATSYIASKSVTVVTALGDGVRIGDVPDAVRFEGTERSGWLLPVASVSSFGNIVDVTSLRDAVGREWPWPEGLVEIVQMLLLRDVEGAIRAYSLFGGAEPFLMECKVIDFSGDQPPRLPAAFSKLAEARVAIVGVGSVGSKIAVSLARAGVRRFVLVDDDLLAPHNLVRNELDWRAVGFEKVDAVARVIERVAPGVTILPWPIGVAGQENPSVAATVVDSLTACSLVVDATANASAFLTLAAVCKRARIPLVWGELFAGGTGALMARSRPGLDADGLAVRNHIHGVLGTFEPLPDQKAVDYRLNNGAEVLVAGDAEASSIAATMTLFIQDTLCAGTSSEYPVSAYLFGFRKYWVFKQPFDTIPIDCSGALLPQQSSEGLTAEETASVNAIVAAIEGSTGASDNSPS